jgi:hypothetical protein
MYTHIVNIAAFPLKRHERVLYVWKALMKNCNDEELCGWNIQRNASRRNVELHICSSTNIAIDLFWFKDFLKFFLREILWKNCKIFKKIFFNLKVFFFKLSKMIFDIKLWLHFFEQHSTPLKLFFDQKKNWKEKSTISDMHESISNQVNFRCVSIMLIRCCLSSAKKIKKYFLRLSSHKVMLSLFFNLHQGENF